MQLHSRCLRLIASFISATVGLAVAQAPPLQTTGVEVAASNERTALVRTTGNLASTVDVKVKNTGDRPLLPPLHAVITFTPLNGGNLAGLTMPGALGGLGKDPHQTFFKDLSAGIGEGLAPGAETTFNFTFERPQTLSVSYAVAIHCNRNRDPIAVIGGPYSGQQGVAVRLDASASSDPDGDALTFGWDFGDGTTATGPTPEHAYPSTGLFTVALTVTDARGAAVTRETQVPIAPAGVFALARTRTLDGNGHPLGEVTISQTGPAGEQTFRSDAVSGFASLGGTPGVHSWSFTRTGHLTSYRKTTLTQGQVKVVAFPWLAALSTQRTPLSLLNPTVVKSPAERVALTFLPQAFEQAESVAITELDGQTLPLPLPVGWSPLAAFHVDLPGEAAVDVAASLRLLQAAAVAQPLALVRLDGTAPAWQTAALLSGSGGDRVAAVLRKPGTYAVVLADTLPAGNPAVAVPGEPLPAGNAPEIAAEIAAIGLVNPGANPASLDPARVTAEATVDFTNGAQPLASGAWFRAEVEETYDLTDGRALKTPDYDATFYAYQHPGDASPVTATATFPLRPRILFGPAELTEAHIKVDILALSQFSGGILTPAGGSLALGGVRIGVPAGAVAGPVAAEIRVLPTANLGRFLGGSEALLAFELNLPALADGTVLDTAFAEKLAPDSHFVLARCVISGSESGLQPVLRLRSDSQGVVTSNEPASGPRLPGITGSGQFVIVRIAAPEALITGLVRKVGGAPLPGAQVRVGGEPWLSLTGGAGTFSTLAKPGERTVIGSDPADGNSGQAPASLADAAATAHVEIQTALTGPRVMAVTPADGAQKVSPVTPVVVVFSKALAPATVGANGVVLTKDGEPTAVQAAVSLNGAGTAVSLFPTNPLDAGATYRVTVSQTLTDLAGHPVEGTLETTFTVLPVANRGDAGQLVIYEPGGAGPAPADRALIDAIPGYEPGTDSEKVVAVGSAGTADASVPVILVNESTGTTATVLSKPDGSFANFIEATEDDFISAVFVNTNGTRITIPASRQKFDDGRVGLFRQGGILEAEADGATAQVIVEPNSVPSRTVFRFEQVTVAKVLELTKGVEPEAGKVLGGIQFEEHGERTTVYSDVVFPVKVADLGLPAGTDPATAAFALTVPREINGTVVYEIIDAMDFRETGPGKGELVTASPPFVGLLLREIAALRKETGLRDSIAENISRTIADGAISAVLPIGAIAVPVLLGTVEVSNLHGTTYVETPPAADAPEGTPGVRSTLAGSIVRLGPPGVELLPDVFTAGTFIAVSDPQGKYALRLPGFLSALASATHKRFPGQVVRTGFASAGGISGKRADFVFIKEPTKVLEIEDTSPPSITIRQLGLVATVGETAGAGIVLDETVTDDLRIASASGPKLVSFTSIIGDNEIAVDAAEKSLLEGFDSLRDDAGLPTTLHRQWRLQSKRAGRAVYRFEASDGVAAGGNQQETRITVVEYTVVFSTTAAPPEDPSLPPRVVSFAWPPAEAVNIARGTPLILRFSRPLTQAQAENTSWLKAGTGSSVLHIDISPDFREIRVAYWLTDPAAERVTFTIEDLAVARRNPGQLTADSGETTDAASQFTHSFSFAAKAALETGSDAILTGGFGGVVQLGSHVWVLERGTESGRLLHYEIVRNDNEARLDARPADTFAFQDGEGRPMDLILIPGYALASVDGTAAKEETYLAVLAGPLQGNDPGLAASKRAHIFRITPAGKPEPFLIRGESPVLTDTISLITRGRWDPPFMSYLEIGETTSVSLLTFNGLVQEARDRLAQASLPKILRTQPARVDGLDLDNDGDFADAGEKAPNRGLEFTWSPLSGQERIVDYDFSADFGLLGAVLRPLGAGPNVFAMVLGGKGQVDDETARVTFDHAAKRMKLLPRQRLVRPVKTTGAVAQLFFGQSNNDIVRDIALVSCVNGNPGTDPSVLVVIDITNPAAPQILIEATLPLGIGSLNSIVPREDGLLAVSATGGGMFLLDPTLLLAADAEGRTAALRQQIPGLETNVNTFASSADGFNIANLGNQLTTAITQPSITVLKPRFKDRSKLRSAQGIVDAVRGVGNPIQRETWDRFLLDYEATGLGGNAGVFDPEQPEDPQRHFYVVVKASGLAADADGNLPLAMAAVSSYGRPLLPSLSNRAPTFVGNTTISKALVGYAALKAAHFLAEVDIGGEPGQIATNIGNQLLAEAEKSFLENGFIKRFLDGAPDYPDEMVARRLSNDPSSPLFNTYVAGPIVLLHQDAPKALVEDEQQNALKRTFLRASPFFWVGLAPTLRDDPFVGNFASKQLDDLDLEVDASPGKLIDLTKNIGNILIKPKHPIMALTQIALELSTAVDGEFQRTFEPGHVALVNFGFRRNPVVFIPGVMASRLINPAVEDANQRLRWLSVATAARAHARELLKSVAPELLAGQIAQVEDNLNKRMADLTILPAGVDAGGNALPVRSAAPLDTEDILRTVGLGQVVADLRADSILKAIGEAVSGLLSVFRIDLPSLPSGPLVDAILNKVNKPVYEPLLIYLNGYLGMDEYKHEGRNSGLRLKGSGAVDPASGLALTADPNWESLETGPELFVFPYDWRLDNADSARKLAEFIELINVVHPDAPKVDLVCHSMGGLVARRYVLEHPDRVDRFISVNSPFLGATKTLAAMKTGDMGDLTMSLFVPQPRMKILTRHMPAVHQLLPTKELLDLGLPVLQENGWDLDGDGNAFENLDYEGYRNALDGSFFRISKDEIDRSVSKGPSGATDQAVLSTQPQPIATNHEPFHSFPANSRGQADWRGDSSGVRYTHFVSLQNQPATIMGLEARPVLIPEALQPNLSLSLPPVDFFETEDRIGDELPIIPAVTQAIEVDPAKAFRMTWLTEVLHGGGDGTVPFLSQARGFGRTKSAGNLNARDATMFPIHNPKEEQGDDSLAGHNDCMRNPQLWAWVGKALQDEIVTTDQPTLTLSGGTARENEPATFSAAIGNNGKAQLKPAGRAAPTERIVWDMGDGAVIQGATAVHTYRRAGTYTVTCTLSYQPGAAVTTNPETGQDSGSRPESLRDVGRRPTFGAVESMKVIVAENDPVLAIDGPADVGAGALAVYQLNLQGRGAEDGRVFRWSFGDGTAVDPGDSDNYVVQHVFASPGGRTIKAELLAPDGSVLQQATKAVTVHFPDAIPAQSSADPAPAPPARSPNGVERAAELIELEVTGHTADPDDLEIRHDGRLVHLGTRVVQVTGGATSSMPSVGHDRDSAQVPGAQSILITRDPPDVAETTVRLHGERARLLARFTHFRLGSPLKFWYHRFSYNPTNPFDSELVFTIRWASLPTLASASLGAIANTQGPFKLTEAAVLREADDRGPNLNPAFSDRDGGIAIRADDNALVAGEVIGDGSDQAARNAKLMVGLPWPPGAPAVGGDGGVTAPHPLEDTQVFQASNQTATRDAVPGAVSAEDRAGRTSLTSSKDAPAEAKVITQADIDRITASAMKAFELATENPLLLNFVFNLDDLWLFEQGSGGNLWRTIDPAVTAEGKNVARQKLAESFVVGKSDNDYEIFLPVFKQKPSGHLSDPDDPAEFAAFPKVAHQPEYMKGDWYFKRPEGVTADGKFLGTPPDPDDREVWNRYVNRTAVWLYARPVDETTILPLVQDRIAKTTEPPFNLPATPAEVIAHVLTETVKSNPTLSKDLPEVSFFPVRREHLEFACLALDRPPPFGDDPIGDAGMGRQALLLKWLLEGSFLPPFEGLNGTVGGSAARRAILFDRLAERQALLAVEGFEWGIFQQWAAFRENTTFRVRPDGGSGPQAEAVQARERCRQVFGNFLDAHDEKVMKKAGKAGIRAALAAMVVQPESRARLFSLPPAAFDRDPALPSFEHFIAQQAALSPGVFDVERLDDLIDDFLKTKVGDPRKFRNIRERPAGVDDFIFAAHDFMAGVQESTAAAYQTYQTSLLAEGRVNEFETRANNAGAIEHGFAGFSGPPVPGRQALAGLLPAAATVPDLNYSFVVAVAKTQTERAVPGVRVALEVEPQRTILSPPLTEPAITLPAAAKVVTIKDVDPVTKKPLLTLQRPATATGALRQHRIALTIEDPAEQASANKVVEDDAARLESEIMGVPTYRDDALVPVSTTRWVYRGLRFAPKTVNGTVITAQQQVDQLLTDQLAKGVHVSASRLAGIPDAERLAAAMTTIRNKVTSGGSLEFPNEDLQLMNTPQLLACQHLTEPEGTPDSIAISTAEDPSSSIEFAVKNLQPQELGVLLAFEVPMLAQPSAEADTPGKLIDTYVQYVETAKGAPRLLNPGEGREIDFFFEIRFRRCVALEVAPGLTPDPGDFTLRRHLGTFSSSN